MIVTFSYGGEGYEFEHPDGDHIGRIQQRAGSFYELPLLEELRARLLGRPGIVVDVGAHVGNHSVYFARVLGKAVIAIEPNPAVLPLLVRNLERNGVLDRVTVLGCAVGDAEGWHGLAGPPPDGNVGMQRVDFDAAGNRVALTLRDVVPSSRPVALVKIDAEGAEGRVLGGAMGLLLGPKPLLALEAATPWHVAQQQRRLDGFGYRRLPGQWGATPVHLWEAESDLP